MYSVLGFIFGTSISSAIVSFQNGDVSYGIRFVVISVLNAIAIALLFAKKGGGINASNS